MTPLIYALAAAAALSMAGAGVQTLRLHSLQASVAQDRAAQTENALLRERSARATQLTLDAQARKATDGYLAKVQAARVAAAGTDAAYRGLRDALAAGAASRPADDPAAACGAADQRIAILERLLVEGAGLVREGAERVGRLDAKLSGLQEHTKVGQLPVK